MGSRERGLVPRTGTLLFALHHQSGRPAAVHIRKVNPTYRLLASLPSSYSGASGSIGVRQPASADDKTEQPDRDEYAARR